PAASLDSIALQSDDDIFTRQISAMITDKDVLWGISAAAPYEPLQNALRYAADNGAKTIALIGLGGGRLKNLSDVFIEADIKNYLMVQNLHLFILQSVCEAVGALMFRQV
ncbi:MAG: hypothetical protein LBP51_00010, partial [Deferribacteraceae bacterium]|nr:hypothetical protein [Deferribacteraceae bacterium]